MNLTVEYTDGMEPSFDLVSGENQVVKQVNLSVNHEPQDALEAIDSLIRGALDEGLVSAQEKGALAMEARKKYNHAICF